MPIDRAYVDIRGGLIELSVFLKSHSALPGPGEGGSAPRRLAVPLRGKGRNSSGLRSSYEGERNHGHTQNHEYDKGLPRRSH